MKNQQLKESAKYLVPIGAVGGFISDVLTPLGPITKWLFFIMTTIVVILIIMHLFKLREISKKYLPSSIILQFIFGLFFLVNNNTDRGVLGDNTDSISKFQEKIFNLQEGVNRVENKINNIDDKLDIRFDEVENLIKSSNPIKNPKTANDFILNAYLYKNSGNLPKSEYAFEQFFNLTGLEKFDLYLDYFSVLKTNYGRIKALEILKSTSQSKFIEVIEVLELNTGYKILELLESIDGLPIGFMDWLLVYASNDAIMAYDAPIHYRDPAKTNYTYLFDLYNRDLSLGKEKEKVYPYFFNKSNPLNLITDVDGGKPYYYNMIAGLQINIANKQTRLKMTVDLQLRIAARDTRSKERALGFLKRRYGQDFDPYNYNSDDIVRKMIKDSYRYYFKECIEGCTDTNVFVDIHYNPPSIY